MVKHKKRKHAILSASSAARWINCPASARLEEGKADTSSIYADEGTLAHEIGDLKLRIKSNVGPVGADSSYREWTEDLKKLRNHELYSSEMEDYVEVYVNYVLENWVKAKNTTPDASLIIEQRSDFSHVVPEGFGTSDANIIADDLLEITDLKFGKGVKVDADNNPQLRLYALGVLKGFLILYDIKRVRMSIVQPRLDHISTEEITVDELNAWAEDVVKPAALEAWEGEAEAKPGAWCKFCKAKPNCKALAEHNLALAKHEFADPRQLSDSEILNALEKGALLTDWFKTLNEYVLSSALSGKSWKGYKLVEGRANRKWADEDKALKVLTGKGFKLNEITNTKIKGIGDVEKLVGKADFNKMDLTIKPQGKPALVPEDDKRPALGVEQAKKDFS